MEIDIQEIRVLASRNPNMRINTLLHHLEKRQKVEELRRAQEQHMGIESQLQQAVRDWQPKRETTFWSAFNRMMGKDT